MQGKIGIYKDTNILSFVITDEQGNKFYFERGDCQLKDYNINVTSPRLYPATGSYYVTQSWELSKVITYTGKQIDFTYETAYLEYPEVKTEQLDASAWSFDNDGILLNDPLKIKEELWKGYKVHLKKIGYPNSTSVSFDLSHSSDARCDCKGNFVLNNIIVESHFDALVSRSITYRLNHSYFNTAFLDMTAPLNCLTARFATW